MRILAPAREQWAKAARHPQTEHPALSLPRRGVRWPRPTLGARARPRRELAGRGFRGRRRVLLQKCLLTSKKKKMRMGGGLSRPRHKPFSKTQPPAATRRQVTNWGIKMGS